MYCNYKIFLFGLIFKLLDKNKCSDIRAFHLNDKLYEFDKPSEDALKTRTICRDFMRTFMHFEYCKSPSRM